MRKLPDCPPSDHRKGFRMLSTLVSPIRICVRALVASNTPAQIAAGFTLGMMIGFVPKSNLIALSLFVLVFSIRCNKGFALLAAVLFTCVATWTDPFAHKVGLMALSMPSMQANYASMFTLPLGPWWGFHNTVVVGSLLLGLYLAYPVYWLVSRSFGFLPRETTP
jgi:uncharacterized protein (TIGR03546 family)